MNGNRGKMGTQAGHAYLHTFWDSEKRFPLAAQEYRNEKHAKKITLVVDTIAELEILKDAYSDICGVSLVTDAAFTVFSEPTTTCLGIGPIGDELVGEDLKALKVLI